jgi:hypothetical protein
MIEEEIDMFKQEILNLKKSLEDYFEMSNTEQDIKMYNVPGVINKDKADVKAFLKISSQFDQVMKMKNKHCAALAAKRDFTGGNQPAELKMKIDLMNKKIQKQNEILENEVPQV